MEEFNNKHEGERVFILGTGPSLNKTPLEQLKDEYTISMNKINLIYNETSWKPTYYVFYDVAHFTDSELPEHRRENVKENIESGITSFIAKPGMDYFGNKKNIHYFNYDHNISGYDRIRSLNRKDISSLWSEDISNKIYNFGSTISVAAQIAIYMGFDEIYFLGTDLYRPEIIPISIFDKCLHPVDYDFGGSETKLTKIQNFISDSNCKIGSLFNLVYYILLVKKIRKLKNLLEIPHSGKTHFSSEYIAGRDFSHRQVNKKMIQVHEIIKIASNKYDFKVFNATVGGYLEVYDRVDIYELLK